MEDKTMLKKRKIIQPKNLMKLGVIFMTLAIIFSMLSFMSNYVYAAPGDSWDLSNFVQNVTMTDTSGNAINSDTPTFIGQSYIFNINFAETSQMQLSYAGSPVGNALIFQLPSQLKIQNAVGPSQIRLGADSSGPVVGSYTIDTSGQVVVRFNEVNNQGVATPGTNFIDNYTNVNFWLNITAQLMAGGDGNLDFGNIVVEIEPPIKPEPKLQVTKSGQVDPNNGDRINYMVTITALGDSINGIVLSDTVSITNSSPAMPNITTPNNPFFGFRYSINGGTNFMPIAVTWNGNTFSYDFSGIILQANDYITVYYSLDVAILLANNKLENALSYSFNIYNTAGASAGEITSTPDPSVTIPINRILNMSKSGTIKQDPVSNNYYIAWTIQVGPVLDNTGNYTPINTATPLSIITDQLQTTGLYFDDPLYPANQPPSTGQYDAMNNINIQLYENAGSPTLLTPDWVGSPNDVNTNGAFFVMNPMATGAPGYTGFSFSLPPSSSVVGLSSAIEADFELNDDLLEGDITSDDVESVDDASQSVNDTTADEDHEFNTIDDIEVEPNKLNSNDGLKATDGLGEDSYQSDNEMTTYGANVVETPTAYGDLVASSLEVTDIYSVIITYNTAINAPPLVGGRPSVSYQNTVGFGDNNKTATVQVNPPAIAINKQTSGICGNPTDGYYVNYSIDFTIPAGNIDQTFYLYDTLGTMPGNGTVPNTPIDFIVSATMSNPLDAIDKILYTTPVVNGNQWRVYFGTTDPVGGRNEWQYNHDVAVNITYRVNIDPSVVTGKLQSSSSTMLQNTVYIVNGGIGSTPGQGTAVSVGGRNVNDYWPIFKSAQNTSNPALFNYTVILNGGYSGRTDPLFGSSSAPKNPVFTDTFDSRLSYVPGSFYMRNSSTGAIYAPPPGSDVAVSSSSFTTYLNTLQLYTAPPSIGGVPKGPNPEPPNWYTVKQNLEVHYQLIIRDQYLETVLPNMVNTASIAVNPNECTFQSTATVNYNPQQIAKTVTTNGSDLAHVEIVINPDGGFIFSDGVHPAPDQIVATDDLTNLMVYLSQISVYTESYVNGHWDGIWKAQPITYNDSALWSVNVASANQINFVLPNQTPVKIVYDALITLPPGEPGTIGNKISIFGMSDGDGRDDYVVSNTTGGASADALRLRLFKQDPINNIKIPGAQFTLYVTDLQNPGAPPYGITDPPMNINGVNFYPLVANRVTDNFGMATFDNPGINTTYQFLFMLYEDVIPMGYSPQPQNPSPLEASTFFTIKPDINQTLLANAVNQINSNLPSEIVVSSITDFITINNVPEWGPPGSIRLWKLFTGIDTTDQHYLDQLADLQIVITDMYGTAHTFTLAQALDPFGIVIKNAVPGTYFVQEYNAGVEGYNLRTTPVTPFRFVVSDLQLRTRQVVFQMNNIYTIPVIPLPPGVPNYPESLNILKVINGLTDEQIQSNLQNAAITITGPAGFYEEVSLLDAVKGVTFEDVEQGSYFFNEINYNVSGFDVVTTPQVPFRRYIMPTTSGAVTIQITNEYTPVRPVGPAPQTGVNHNMLIPAIFVMLGGGCIAVVEVHRRRSKRAKN